jgi:probable F420-dependent oxidoreductase
MPVTFGCNLPAHRADLSPGAIRSLAQHAEDLRFDAVWFADHVVIPREVASVYPYSPDGVSTFRPDIPFYEPLSTLLFLAGCTRRVRLGTNVLVVPYRPPVLTAKLLTMLDILSDGRLTVGVGVGWMAEEFAALGAPPYEERGAVTDEYLRLFKALWTEDEPTFTGKYCRVSGIGFLPKPVQRPHPPIWVGGHTDRALRRAAELGDGWIPLGTFPPAVFDPEELTRKVARLRALTVQAGRPEHAVEICFGGLVMFDESAGPERPLLRGHPEQIAADLRQFQALGVTNFILYFTRPRRGARGWRGSPSRWSGSPAR